MALPTVDRLVKRLPPRATKLEPDLDRRSILKLTDGVPLSIIVVNIDSSEIHETETWQWNSTDDGGVFL